MEIDFIVLVKNLFVDKKIQFENIEIDNFEGFSLSNYDKYIDEFLAKKFQISYKPEETWSNFINHDVKEKIPGVYIHIKETLDGDKIAFENIWEELWDKYSISLISGLLSVEYKNAAIPVVVLVQNCESGEIQKTLLNLAYKGCETKTIFKGKFGVTQDLWSKDFFEKIKRIKNNERIPLFFDMYSEMQSEKNVQFKFFRAWNILETMSYNEQGKYKMDKVRRLAEKLKIGIYPISVNGFDDIYCYIYKVRNDIAHEGKTKIDLSSYHLVNDLVSDFILRYISQNY